MKFIFTSEAVTEGHPDKVADRIADSILDELLKKDKNSRVACEVVCAANLVFIFGEITTTAKIDYEKVARETVKEIGYTKHEYGFSYDTIDVKIALNTQSPDIALGVDENENKELGAGDQGIMFGYASNETDEYMPLGSYLAQNLAKELTKARKEGIIKYLRPDGKTQVSFEYHDGKPVRIHDVVVSTQHAASASQEAETAARQVPSFLRARISRSSADSSATSVQDSTSSAGKSCRP